MHIVHTIAQVLLQCNHREIYYELFTLAGEAAGLSRIMVISEFIVGQLIYFRLLMVSKMRRFFYLVFLLFIFISDPLQ